MQSTGHSSTHALSSRSTHGSAMMYVTARPFTPERPHVRGGLEPSIPPVTQSMRWSTALGRDDVGHRVVLRRIVPLPGNRVAYSDVVGWLVAADEIQLTVRTRTGEVTLRRAEIAHGKRIPDRRAETSTEVLERVAAAGWPAPDLDRLGGWLLRAAEGWTNRGNSALAVGDPDVPLADAGH